MARKERISVRTILANTILTLVIALIFSCENPANGDLISSDIRLLVGEREITEDDEFDYGHIEMGSGGREVAFTVENIGDAAMSLVDVLIVSNSGSFQITAPLPISNVPSEGLATFTIRFNPISIGKKTATVSVICDDPDSPVYSFRIIGTVDAVPVQPEIQVSQGSTIYESNGSTYTFPSVPTGYVGPLIAFAIANVSDADLLVETISIGDSANYTLIAPSTPFTIPGYESRTFEVVFNPGIPGVIETTVVISNNDLTDNENPYILNVGGNGTATAPEISVLRAGTPFQDNGIPFDFGSIPEGITADPVAFTIRNDGTGDLAVSSIALEDENNYVLTPPSLPFVLSPGGSKHFAVSFSPDAVGTFSSEISIDSDDSDESPFIINLAGEGVVLGTIQVTSTNPANGTIDVPINGDIHITFDTEIDPSSITGTTIEQDAVVFPYSWSYDAPAKTVVLNPDSQFSYQSDVTVTLPPSIIGINYELFGGFSFTFTTLTPWHDGNTVFVSATGSGGNPGTKSQPVKSVQEGLDLAVTRGYSQVYVESGTYSHSNGGLAAVAGTGIHITDSVSLVGGWNSTFTVHSGTNSILDVEGNRDHVVHIESSDVSIEYFTCTGADSLGYGGGIYVDSSEVQDNINVTNITVEYNTAAIGAGVYIDALSRDVTFTDCIVRNNTATMRGAGFSIATYTLRPTLNNVQILDNTGEGISSTSTWSMTIDGCTLSNNSGVAGIYLWNGSSTVLTSTSIRQDNVCVFLNSNSGESDPHSNLVIDNCSFGATGASTTAIAVKEGQSDVHGHTVTNNEFLPDNLGYLYEDWDNTLTADSNDGLINMNTASHADHDALVAAGNSFVY